MAYQQSDLDKLDQAIASGIRSVTFADGRRTEYQSLDHLLAARNVVAAQINLQAEASGGPTRRRTPYYRSGL